MRLTHHNPINNHGSAHMSDTLTHLAGSRSYAGVVAFSMFFTLSIIAVMLLLWFIYLRRREQQMQASGAPGIVFAGQMVMLQPQGFGGIPMGQPIMQTQNMGQPAFMQPSWLNCGGTVLPLPSSTLVPSSTNLPMSIPIRTSTVQTIPPNTTVTGIPLSSAIVQPVNQMQVTEIVTVVPTQISAIAGLPLMPTQTSKISSVGVDEPITTINIHNRSLSSQGILDSGHDARRMAEMGVMAPQIIYDNRVQSPNNSIMQQIQLPFMLAELREPYSSQGPDIPIIMSKVLGPSPTGGYPTPNNMSSISPPPHLTEAGLRMSQIHHSMGVFQLMSSGNIMGFDTIKSVPHISPPIPNLPFQKKITSTTEIVQPTNQLKYPTLSSPAVRPGSTYAPVATSTGVIPGAMPLPVSSALPLLRP